MIIERRSLVCFTLALSCLVSVSDASTIRTVALTGPGSLAPGADGANFSALGTPILNDVGQIAFNGTLIGTGVNPEGDAFGNNRGIWSEGGGNGLTLIARSGSSAPGAGSDNFHSNVHEDHDFGIPILNNAGQVVFSAILSGTGVNSSNRGGIWSQGENGELSLVARSGDAAPGTEIGANFSSLGINYSPIHEDFISINDSSQTAFFGSLTSSKGRGIWSEREGNGLALIARSGDVAPGSSGAKFSNFGNVDVGLSNFSNNPSFNNSGQTAFQGTLTGTGVNYANGIGIWSEGGGNGLALVARAGDVAPGTDGDRFFSDGLDSFGIPAFNDAGQTAFTALLTDTDVGVPDYELEWGIWSEGGGNGLALVAHAGDVAPGTDGTSFKNFGFPALNNAGHASFRGGLTGAEVNSGNRLGIWSEGKGNGIALVARTGDAAPGTNGALFSNFNSPVLNDWGQTAFSASLNNNRFGIWAEDRSGVLSLIVSEGDLLDVDDGPNTEFRQIESLSFLGDLGSSQEDTRLKGFNKLGQLVFHATFTDGTSGIFVSNLVAVPEPGALMLLGMSGVGLLFHRGKK